MTTLDLSPVIKGIAWKIKKEVFPELKITQVYDGWAKAIGFKEWQAFTACLAHGLPGMSIETILVALSKPTDAAKRFSEATGVDIEAATIMCQDILVPATRALLKQ